MGLFDRARARAQEKGRPIDRGPAPQRSGGGLYVGRTYDDATKRADEAILYKGDRHMLVFGPTGCGKTTRLLMPNLLDGLEDVSVIVIDPKGQLAAVTAEHRRKLGHKVVLLNPFNALGLGSDGFNPLANLDPKSPQFYDHAAGIGEALIKIEGNDPHWPQSAQGLVVGLVMWEKLRRGDKANLEDVRMMLTEPDEYVEGERNGKKVNVQTAGLRVTARRMVRTGGPVIASLGGRFLKEHKELDSIQSTADTQTRWMLSSQIGEDLKKNGIDFSTLKDRLTTVYVILPAEDLTKNAVWLRLVLVTALRSLYRPGGNRTVMMIDEMAALGHLGPLEDAFGLVRGYRVQIVSIFQDLPQLRDIYKERAESFMGNAGVILGFAPTNIPTAEWMSKRSGQTTVIGKSFSENTGFSSGQKASMSQGSGLSDQEMARPLFLPHELFNFEDGMGLLWLAGYANGMKFFAPFYKKIRACKDRAQPDPYEP